MQVKVAITYQLLSQTERYQIYILIQDGRTQTQIAKLMDGHKPTISRELLRNTGGRLSSQASYPVGRRALLRLS
ncbi:helix-turn-helix domain-containing protein [Polynucleobacter sp.]|uniref:helix-turn-helix domain-containing protein n=1 Tax=Polynucleobacter sp. TaxID=2029855 RepID=UPI00351D86B5